MQLTQAQSPSSSHNAFSRPASYASAAGTLKDMNTTPAHTSSPDGHVWTEVKFKMRRRLPDTLVAAGQDGVSSAQSQTAPETSQSQSSARGLRGAVYERRAVPSSGYSQLALQTQAPYFSQSVDSQGESQ